MKKVLAIILAALLIACAAANAQTGLKARAEYEGFGVVELGLNRDVTWDTPVVTFTDSFGMVYDSEVLKYDRDDVEVLVGLMPEDHTYTCTVSGFSGGGTVSCELYAASERSSMIRKVEYDADDRELDIEFAVDVEFENPAVTVSDANGSLYETRIIERDNDSLDVRVSGLTRGSTYTVTVSGVRARTSDTFESCSLEFVARDD